jgi:hypothetical protein
MDRERERRMIITPRNYEIEIRRWQLGEVVINLGTRQRNGSEEKRYMPIHVGRSGNG